VNLVGFFTPFNPLYVNNSPTLFPLSIGPAPDFVGWFFVAQMRMIFAFFLFNPAGVNERVLSRRLLLAGVIEGRF